MADASHELRSPVAAIRTELEVAQRTAAPDDWPRVAERLLAEEARLEAVIADLLLLASLDEGAGRRRRWPSTWPRSPQEEARRRVPDRDGVVIEVDAPAPGGGARQPHAAAPRRWPTCSTTPGATPAPRCALSVHERDGRVRVLVDDDGAGHRRGRPRARVRALHPPRRPPRPRRAPAAAPASACRSCVASPSATRGTAPSTPRRSAAPASSSTCPGTRDQPDGLGARRWPYGSSLHRIEPGAKVDLATLDPDDTSAAPGGKVEPRPPRSLTAHRRGWPSCRTGSTRSSDRSVLLVLQGLDTSGKGGTIEHVLGAVNPVGLRVTSFKAPSAERARPRLPLAGPRQRPRQRARSECSTAATTRTCSWRGSRASCPRSGGRRRFAHINAFEQLLADEGTTIVKVLLHLSKAEQKRRLEARLAEPAQALEVPPGRPPTRASVGRLPGGLRGGARAHAHEPHAPWHVVPADKKWYRNWAVATILVATLEDMDLRWPEPEDLSGVVIPD